MSDKIGFKTKTITRDKEKHYLMIKGSVPKKHNNCKYSCNKHGSGDLVAKSCPALATAWTVAHQAPLSMGFLR